MDNGIIEDLIVFLEIFTFFLEELSLISKLIFFSSRREYFCVQVFVLIKRRSCYSGIYYNKGFILKEHVLLAILIAM